jgi:uroporphyrinogen-III decarboxylase
MFVYPNNWNTLSSDEKMEARFEYWISGAGTKFGNPEAEKNYRQRAQRIKDIIQLKKPDRVPCMPSADAYVAEYGGISYGDMFYDAEKAAKAIIKFHRDFQPDYKMVMIGPGKMYERLGIKTYRWPGGGLPLSAKSYQMVEGEYMLADEYDKLIADPEGFFMRTYMPRAFTALAGWQMLPTFYNAMEFPTVPALVGVVAMPQVRQSFEAFLEAGQFAAEFMSLSAKITQELVGNMGMPSRMGGFWKVPYDIIGDTLRGTKGIMMDMFQRPDKILAASERLVPISIQMGIEGANKSGIPISGGVLHKGDDTFMSDAQFKKFYWPYFKAVMLGLMAEGVVPAPFIEGRYNTRLDIIAESGLPAKKTYWRFDQTDMLTVKKKFGGWACFGGNVPTSMLLASTPQEIKDYCKNLIETVGQDGGYFLAPGADIDVATEENMHALIDSAREFGVYT